MPWEHYLLPLLDYRIRVEWNVERGRLLSWAVQLEWLDPEEGRFVWVARYDTAGGLPHRDRNRIGGGSGGGEGSWERHSPARGFPGRG